MSMTPEAWEFPRSHGVKAIGLNTEVVEQTLIAIIKSLHLNFEQKTIASKTSSNRRYISVTIDVHFTHAKEVEQLYGRLHDHPDIVQSL